jgi:hypothetical protein
MRATTRLAARQVRRRHQITVIRATGARQDRSSADSRVCAGSGQPLPSPWIALLRVPVTAPGQTVRVYRTARRRACAAPPATRPSTPFPSWLRCAQGVIFPGAPGRGGRPPRRRRDARLDGAARSPAPPVGGDRVTGAVAGHAARSPGRPAEQAKVPCLPGRRPYRTPETLPKPGREAFAAVGFPIRTVAWKVTVISASSRPGRRASAHAHLGAHGAEHDVAVEPLDLPVA